MPATSSRGPPPAAGGGGGLAEPLLPREEPQTSDRADAAAADRDADADGEEETDYRTWPVAAAALLAIGGLAASAVAMISAPGAIAVYVAGAVCILNSASVPLKERVIVKQGGLGKTINKLKDQTNLLRGEVGELGENVDGLVAEVNTMKEAGVALDIITRKQGSNCDEIISLLRENKEILKKQKSYLRQVAIADITEIILESDRDGSFTIDTKEVAELTLRVQLQLSSHGIYLEQDQFKAIIMKDNDITHVLKVVGAIMFGETIEGKRLSKYAEEAPREEEEENWASLAAPGAAGSLRKYAESREEGTAAGRETSGSSLAPSDAAGHFQQVAESAEGEEEESEDEEEMPPMFSMKFNRVSSDSAHGERASVTSLSSPKETETKRSNRRRLLNKCKRIKHRLH